MTDLATLPMTTLDTICRELYADIYSLEVVASRNSGARSPYDVRFIRTRAARRLIKSIRRTLRGRLTTAANARPTGERW
ncbi:MAG TPA: hypothetical protein ENH89_19660 [Aurantimonas coralicida]|nr:hypothetical protein [Aurantimonas coralicida]